MRNGSGWTGLARLRAGKTKRAGGGGSLGEGRLYGADAHHVNFYNFRSEN